MAPLLPGSLAPSQTQPPRRTLPAQLAAPLRAFLQTESGSAGLLLGATVVALVWSNSPWSDAYERLWATELAVRLAGVELALDLRHWLADGLMAVFFFVVGLELRRELSVGELTDRRQLVLPGIAALGGVVVPAALYLLVNPSGAEAAGWGVVIGTDTAFLLGALALVGPEWPTQLRVFLLTLMIADDVVAVSVIGGVYSGALDARAMLLAGVCLAALGLLARWGVWRLSVYVLIGLALWSATLASGLHPTLAGMAGGLMVPAHPPRRDDVEHAARLFHAFRQSPLPSVGYSAELGLQRAVSVNERLQGHLHPWTSYVIVPVFALANVGVDLRGGVLGEALGSAVTWGVVLGLVVGKLIGVGGAALGGVRLGWGSLPQGVGEGQIVGGAALCGIGFTVSLLIAGLAFDRADLRAQATVGVLLAAVLATALSWAIFRAAAVLRGERTASLPMVLSEPVDPARDHILGPPDAALTLVEYSDFECPFCGRATGVVRELLGRMGPELRYVFRHLPLPEVHPYALVAARAAEAAAAQGHFWPMHDLLFSRQDQLQPEDVLGYAADLGLDVERFARDLGDPRLDERIRRDMLSAEASGARGTPTFFVNGRRHLGPYDSDSLERALRSAPATP